MITPVPGGRLVKPSGPPAAAEAALGSCQAAVWTLLFDKHAGPQLRSPASAQLHCALLNGCARFELQARRARERQGKGSPLPWHARGMGISFIMSIEIQRACPGRPVRRGMP
mmetsp:Transcript_21197/g.63504  ORF Transcript_21197/g.63504 Transcript_21197/m.63504 type:complete len:112 (-) Transcript_21197:11-346(-)